MQATKTPIAQPGQAAGPSVRRSVAISVQCKAGEQEGRSVAEGLRQSVGGRGAHQVLGLSREKALLASEGRSN